MNAIRVFENRKDDIYYKMMRRKVDEELNSSSEEEIISSKRKLASLTIRNDPAPKVGLELDSEFYHELSLVKKEFVAINNTLQSLLKTQESHKLFVESTNQDLKIHVEVLEDNIKNIRKEERENNSQGLITMTEKIENYRNKLRNCYEAIINLSELVSTIVEFSIVTNAVLDQEEKDKKELTKESSELLFPPVTTRKQSMHSSDFLSGKGLLHKPQISYNSTPLKYKNVIYSREELIELIGKVISKA